MPAEEEGAPCAKGGGLLPRDTHHRVVREAGCEAVAQVAFVVRLREVIHPAGIGVNVHDAGMHEVIVR